jgi:hypothetical protein
MYSTDNLATISKSLRIERCQIFIFDKLRRYTLPLLKTKVLPKILAITCSASTGAIARALDNQDYLNGH